MKTWLFKDEAGWVFRNNEYNDEPEWIGCVETTKTGSYFKTYGDNRVFSAEELKQILDFL